MRRRSLLDRDGLREVARLVDVEAAPRGDRVGQLLAYRIARLRGLNVDQPRNLAKTVTVE